MHILPRGLILLINKYHFYESYYFNLKALMNINSLIFVGYFYASICQKELNMRVFEVILERTTLF